MYVYIYIYIYICIYTLVNSTRATRLQQRGAGFTRRIPGVTCVTSR